jgi:hypothetical protein
MRAFSISHGTVYTDYNPNAPDELPITTDTYPLFDHDRVFKGYILKDKVHFIDMSPCACCGTLCTTLYCSVACETRDILSYAQRRSGGAAI